MLKYRTKTKRRFSFGGLSMNVSVLQENALGLYVEINIVSILLLFILAIRSFQVGIDAVFKKRAFIFAIVSCIVANLADITASLIGEGIIKNVQPLMFVLAILYFVAHLFTTISWINFSDMVHKDSKVKYCFFMKVALSLPITALVVAEIFNINGGFFFYFDEAGAYHRGEYFYLQHLVAFAYVLWSAILNFVRYLNKENYTRRRDYLALLIFSLPPLIAMILQLFFRRLPIISIYPPISFLLTYMHSLRLQISLDPLTAINNRRTFVLYLERKTKQIKKDQKLCLFFVDIDNFKNINDNFGHFSGDKVLQLVADALSSLCLENGGTCARYGGDEFSFVQEIASDEDAISVSDAVDNAIRTKCEEENFTFEIAVSIGFTVYDTERDSVQTFINRADRKMYNIKRERRKHYVGQ